MYIKTGPGRLSVLLLLSLFLWRCENNGTSEEGKNSNAVVKMPATAVMIRRRSMQKGIWLNATSNFLKKSAVKSTVNGYIISSSLLPGQHVQAGETLFVLQTKEARAIGDLLPDSLKFNGKVIIHASQSGFIGQLDHLQGDYVADGEQLCVIVDKSSYAFLLQVPFEYNNDININSQVEILLPNGRQIKGRVASRMPLMDSVSQTQQYLIHPEPGLQLPGNLIAKVRIIIQSKHNVQVLPKTAVLSDESQSAFWVMKLINDTTALKVPVKKGLEDSNEVEIISPRFSPGTRILNTGNYGLPDTAFVTLTQSSSQ